MASTEQFGDLYRIQRGPLAQVIADAPERQSVRMRQIATDSSDEDLIAAGAVHRHRVFVL